MRTSLISKSWLLPVFLGVFIACFAGCRSRHDTPARDAASPAPIHRGPIRLGFGERTTTPPPAPSPDSGAVAALDVAGVRLGMTPEQVIAALKAFDSQLVQAKRYRTDTSNFYPASPTETEECSDKAPYRLFSSIAAAKGTRLPDAPSQGVSRTEGFGMGGQFVGCGEEAQPGDSPETVLVYFSPTPGQHRVIGVSLWRSFKTAATVDAVMDSALKKYPADFTAKADRGYEKTWSWRFDDRGRVMSEDTARRQSLLNSSIDSGENGDGMPGTLYEGHGIGVDLAIGADYNNQQIAKEFRVSLYNEDALYKFIGEAKALYDAFHEKQLRDETEKARKAEAPVKM